MTQYANLCLGLAVAAVAACYPLSSYAQVPAPPILPSSFTWNGSTAPFWGYAYGDQQGVIRNANFSRFQVVPTLTESRRPGTGELGRYFSFTCENGFQEQYQKYFFFYIQGTGAGYLPDASNSPVRGVNDPPNTPSDYSPTYIRPFSATFGDTGAWSVMIEGRFVPQPDRLIFTFNVWGTSTTTNTVNMSNWWFGENCVPAPASLSVLLLTPLISRRRRN